MLVFVEQRHIDEATRHKNAASTPRGTSCPLALALKEQTGQDLYVGCDSVTTPKGYTAWYRMTIEAKQFISQFDSSHDPVTPQVVPLKQWPTYGYEPYSYGPYED